MVPSNPQPLRGTGSIATGMLLTMLAGGFAAFLSSSPAAGQSGCAHTACDRDYNYCAQTDLAYECSGNPCSSAACEAGGDDGGDGSPTLFRD